MLAFLALLGTQATSHVETFGVEGLTRQAVVFPGTGTAPKAGRALLFAFHGHGGNMRFSARSFGIQNYWPEATVVYPDGLPIATKTDPEGVRNGWQLAPKQLGDRDVKFFDAMLQRFVKSGKIDRRRIYAMGHSNGGRFTYVLWASRGDVFAAYGPSGSPATGLHPWLRAASMFATAGESDPIIPFSGQKRSIDLIDRLIGGDASRAKTDGYIRVVPGRNGLELGTYIHPGGHEYPPAAAEATIRFFQRHAKE